MNESSQFKRSIPLFLVVFVLASLALLHKSQAVSPPPDGGYPGQNTAEGQSALLHLGNGTYNTAIGWASLGFDVTGNLNTAVGAGALLFNTADQNTATGAGALLMNTFGTLNTANGTSTLVHNTTGSDNTANGSLALAGNTTGSDNTALGFAALEFNSTSSGNTAVGSEALAFNTAHQNTAIGFQALLSNTAGEFNTAIGYQALFSNTTGYNNTANGIHALFSNTTGAANTADGADALSFNTTGHNNIGLGIGAGNNVTTASGVICIGNAGLNFSNTTWIDNVYGVTTQSSTTAPVIVSADGQLGTVASSERFKKDIASMGGASEAILSLKPVTFHYKTDIKGIAQFGLIAEEVAKVNPALVLPDKEGKPYTVRYDAVNAMLLNEFLKEHRKVEQMQKQIEALTAGLQKVSAQLAAASPSDGGLELSKFATGRIRRGGPAPQTVKNTD